MVFGRVAFFLVGVYAGIYVDQNYKMPKIDDPSELWKKAKEYADSYKKENPGPSKTD